MTHQDSDQEQRPDSHTSEAASTSVRRRAFLRDTALGVTGAAVAFGGTSAALDSDIDAPPTGRRIPWLGPHQAGVTTPPQAAATFASFQIIAPDRRALDRLFRTLTERIGVLTTGGPPAATNLASAPADSGTLGPVLPADGLTITVGVGASLFDHRYGLASRKPAKLLPMPAFPGDHTIDSTELHGDLSLQICADSRDTVMHALRDIAKHTRGAMQPNWKADGFQAVPRPSGTPRNHLGFKYGIANPDVTDPAIADALLWTHGGVNGEPDWAEGGSYQVIRIIRMLVEFWDRVSLNEQEQMIGRRRESGAPLDGSAETDLPAYDADPQGARVPLDSHIRLANPRTRASDNQQILRRGYNYDRGLDKVGGLDVGLIFCCYQQDVSRQFGAIQTRLIGEALAHYVQPTGGGYFFVLPGARGPREPLASGLLGT